MFPSVQYHQTQNAATAQSCAPHTPIPEVRTTPSTGGATRSAGITPGTTTTASIFGVSSEGTKCSADRNSWSMVLWRQAHSSTNFRNTFVTTCVSRKMQSTQLKTRKNDCMEHYEMKQVDFWIVRDLGGRTYSFCIIIISKIFKGEIKSSRRGRGWSAAGNHLIINDKLSVFPLVLNIRNNRCVGE